MSDGDADGRPLELRDAVDAVQDWINRRQRAMVAHLHSCSQSPAQLNVLGVLRELGSATVSRLATQLGISPPSASAIVDRMVDGGLVVRTRNDEDRRMVTVALSPAGEVALRQAVGGRKEMLERVLAQLTDEERRDTIRVLRRLDEAIAADSAAAEPQTAATRD
ncbi:MAG: MarR family transcriptional regulator [Candidatus Dormibacteraeota bacterium]|nr:MarR family transcriptional regulator [Candidatus Dormibacteraeota bacterium]